ncbi:MAG: ATP-binding cassette domain-containing protein [Candidatus Natronoplasma sp.]
MRKYLEVERLGNNIDGFKLEDISFEICQGEVVLLGGGNSSGKTSLLETLCFVRRPDEGKINFFDKQVFDDDLKKKELHDIKPYLGIQFQGDSLFNNLTVMETIELFSESYGMDEISEVVFQCPFLEDVLEKRIINLSEGKTQLVKFLLSIIHDPKIVFLDEPVSTLDGETRSWVYGKIREMRSEGTSFLVTLNDMWKIGKISNRLITLGDGRICQVVDDFSEYYKGCLVKIPIEKGIEDIKDEAWVLKVVKRDGYYDVYSKLPMKTIIERTDVPYFELRDVELRDFSPGVNR